MELMTTKEAADYLKLSEQTLRIWRCQKKIDLPYIRTGRYIRYDKKEVDIFLNKNSFSLVK